MVETAMQVFKVDNWMNKNVQTIGRDRPVVEAAEMMRKYNIGCVIVVEHDEPVGIVTESDIIRKVMAKRWNADQTPVHEIMSGHVITAEIGMDIKEVSDLMVRHNIKKIAVVEGRKLKGIITSTDIVRVLADFNKLYDAKEILELGVN
jgi:CBS domain-containing protein